MERKGRKGKYMLYERAVYLVSNKKRMKKTNNFKEIGLCFGKKRKKRKRI